MSVTALHFSTSLNKTTAVHDLYNSWLDATYCWTFDLSVIQNHTWKLHILSIAWLTSLRFSRLYHHQFFKMVTLYKNFVCLCMKYESHNLDGLIHTALFNRVNLKSFHSIRFYWLSSTPQILLYCYSYYCLLYIYIYCLANCFSKFVDCIHAPLLLPCCSQYSLPGHPNIIRLPYESPLYFYSCIFFSGKLWNSILPVLPASRFSNL